MKRIISIILIAVLMLTLSSCSSKREYVLKVNGSPIVDSEVFAYFLNDAYYSGAAKTTDSSIDIATSESLKYIAVNTHFENNGIKLSLDDKALIAGETNALWRSYGKYYEDIGVSKDSFFKIKQYEFRKESLRLSLYDTDGTEPINENLIKQYFSANYSGIKYFYQELYTPLSDEKLSTMSNEDKLSYEATKSTASERYSQISEIADRVNSGFISIDSAFMQVTGEVSADINVTAGVVGNNDSKFSKEFVDAVSKQAVGTAFIITNPEHSYVYFIEKVDLLSEEYDFYSRYREDCLRAVSESFFVTKINEWIKSYAVTRDYALAKDCLSQITSVDREKYIGTENYLFTPLKAE